MMFGYLYSRRLIKQGSLALDIWISLAKTDWYQKLLTPYHIFAGMYYGIELENIREFVRKK